MSVPDLRHIFDQVWPLIDSIPGWLTKDQAFELFRTVSEVGCSDVVEIGSHQGRSTVTLALADQTRVTAIDPFVTARLFAGPSIRSLLLNNLSRADVEDHVRLLTTSSASALRRWPIDRTLDLVFIDGKHDVVSVLRDLRWAAHVRPDGYIAVHDAFSSIGVTAGLLLALPTSRTLTMTHRVGSLAILRVRRPKFTERVGPALNLLWFSYNLAIKVLLRLRLRSAAARLGHTDVYDPY